MSAEQANEVKQIASAVAEELIGSVIAERRDERDKLIKHGYAKVILAIILAGAAQAMALYNWKIDVDRSLAQQWSVRSQRTWVDRTAIANPAWKPSSVDEVQMLSDR